MVHGETAAATNFSNKLDKDSDADKSLDPTIEKINYMVQSYHYNYRPSYCAQIRLVEEMVKMK